MEGVRPRNVSPIKTLGPSVLIVFPTCLSTYVLAYLSTHPVSRRHDTSSSARSCCADRARMAGKHQQPDLPSWYFSTFTNCAIKFSHRWMTHDVAQRFTVPLSVCAFRGRGFGWRLQGGWDVRFQCYQAISAFSEISNSIFKAIAIKGYKNIKPTNQYNKLKMKLRPTSLTRHKSKCFHIRDLSTKIWFIIGCYFHLRKTSSFTSASLYQHSEVVVTLNATDRTTVTFYSFL